MSSAHDKDKLKLHRFGLFSRPVAGTRTEHERRPAAKTWSAAKLHSWLTCAHVHVSGLSRLQETAVGVYKAARNPFLEKEEMSKQQEESVGACGEVCFRALCFRVQSSTQRQHHFLQPRQLFVLLFARWLGKASQRGHRLPEHGFKIWTGNLVMCSQTIATSEAAPSLI